MYLFEKTMAAMQAIEDGFRRIPPEAIPEKCTGCGLCVKVCPAQIFVLRDKKSVTSANPTSFCIKCGHCLAVCPAGAFVDPEHRDVEPLRIEKKRLPKPEALQMLLSARRSVRYYRPEPVDREVIKKIIEAGRYTATGGNRQDIFYTVIDSAEKIQELEDMVTPYLNKIFSLCENPLFLMFMYLTGNLELIAVPKMYAPIVREFGELKKQGIDRFCYHAPAMILVHTKKMDQPAGFGCAAALYNCSLMAELLGVGCCFNGFVHVATNYNRKIKDWLDIPRSHQCHGAMTLGYPAIKFPRIPPRDPAKIDWR